MLQPLLVRPVATGGYQIVAGERRWRACRMAGITEVPVVIRELSDGEVMELALIENLQREDLSPVEEAEGYQTLIDTYHFTQEEVAHTVGKSRPAVTNALRLLHLPKNVLQKVSAGVLSAGHARTLLAFANEEEMEKAALLVEKQGISVRELERLSKKADVQKRKPSAKSEAKRSTFMDEVELALKETLGRRVRVQNKGANKGVLEIEFYSKEDLADIAARLGREEY